MARERTKSTVMLKKDMTSLKVKHRECANDDKQNEVRQGQLSVYESEIQDLLQLLEMNKKLASAALTCSANTTQSLDNMVMKCQAQQALWQYRVEKSLRQRRERRLKSETWRLWCKVLKDQRCHTQLPPYRHIHNVTSAFLPKYEAPSDNIFMAPSVQTVFQIWKIWTRLVRAHSSADSTRQNQRLLFLRSTEWIYATSLVQHAWHTWRIFISRQQSIRRLLAKVLSIPCRRQLASAWMRWRLYTKDSLVLTWLSCLATANDALNEQMMHAQYLEVQIKDEMAQEHHQMEQKRYHRLDRTMELWLSLRRWHGLSQLRHQTECLIKKWNHARSQRHQMHWFYIWRHLSRDRIATRRLLQLSHAKQRMNYLRPILHGWKLWCGHRHLMRRLVRQKANRALQQALIVWTMQVRLARERQQWQLQLQHHRVTSDLAMKLERQRRITLGHHAANYMAAQHMQQGLVMSLGQWKRCLFRRQQRFRFLEYVQRQQQSRLYQAFQMWRRGWVDASWADLTSRAWQNHRKWRQMSRMWSSWRQLTWQAKLRQQKRRSKARVWQLWQIYVRQRRGAKIALQMLSGVLTQHLLRQRWWRWKLRFLRWRMVEKNRFRRPRQTVIRCLLRWRHYTWRQRQLHLWATQKLYLHFRHRLHTSTLHRCYHHWRNYCHRHDRLLVQQRLLTPAKPILIFQHVFTQWRFVMSRHKRARQKFWLVLKRHMVSRRLRLAWYRWRTEVRLLHVHIQYRQKKKEFQLQERLAFWCDHHKQSIVDCFGVWKRLRECRRMHERLAQQQYIMRIRWATAPYLSRWLRFKQHCRYQRIQLRSWFQQHYTRHVCLAFKRWLGACQQHALAAKVIATRSVQASLARLLQKQQATSHHRSILQAWHVHARRQSLQRYWIRRALSREYNQRLHRAWWRWQQLPRRKYHTAFLAWSGTIWSQRRLVEAFQRWHVWKCRRQAWKRVMWHLVLAQMQRQMHRAWRIWDHAGSKMKARIQWHRFLSRMEILWTRQARERNMKQVWLQWQQYRAQNQAVIKSLRQGRRQTRSELQYRLWLCWVHFWHQGRHRRRALQALVRKETCRRKRLGFFKLFKWMLGYQQLASHEAREAAVATFKRKTIQAVLLMWQHKSIARYFHAWRFETTPRRTRLQEAYTAWSRWHRRQLQLRTGHNHRMKVRRFYDWRLHMERRQWNRKRLARLVVLGRRTHLCRGFSLWQRHVRQLFQEECFARVLVIQSIIDENQYRMDNQSLLRQVWLAWRRHHRKSTATTRHLTQARLQALRRIFRAWSSLVAQQETVRVMLQRRQRRSLVSHLHIWKQEIQCILYNRRVMRRWVQMWQQRMLAIGWRTWCHGQSVLRAAHHEQRVHTLETALKSERLRWQQRAATILLQWRSGQSEHCLRRIWEAWKGLRQIQIVVARRQLQKTVRKWVAATVLRRQHRLCRMWQRWRTFQCRAKQTQVMCDRLIDFQMRRYLGILKRRTWYVWVASLRHTHELELLHERRRRQQLRRHCFHTWRCYLKNVYGVQQRAMEIVHRCFSTWRMWREHRHHKSKREQQRQMILVWREGLIARKRGPILQTIFSAWKTVVFPMAKLHWQPSLLQQAALALVASIEKWADRRLMTHVLWQWRQGATHQQHKRELVGHQLQKRVYQSNLCRVWKAWTHICQRRARLKHAVAAWLQMQASSGKAVVFHAWREWTYQRRNEKYKEKIWMRNKCHVRHLRRMCWAAWKAFVGGQRDMAQRMAVENRPVTDLPKADYGANQKGAEEKELKSQQHVLMQCVRVLRLAMMRRSYYSWKQWYIHEAMEEAQRDHAALMHALRDIVTYRQSLET